MRLCSDLQQYLITTRYGKKLGVRLFNLKRKDFVGTIALTKCLDQRGSNFAEGEREEEPEDYCGGGQECR
jgi:hypothetical protein